MEDIKDQNNTNFVNWMDILQEKEELEQKKYLLSMERDYNWQIRDKLLTIEAELLILNDLLPESNSNWAALAQP